MKIKYLILFGFCMFCSIHVYEVTKKDHVIENIIPETTVPNIIEEPLYYGKTKQELIDQINSSLKSDLSFKGELIVETSLEYGVDPYLATAIMMHETGCKWGCSNLVKKCNNVAGQKGKPSCDGGSYKKYESLDEGIKGAIYNIYVNYVKYDLLTAEQMNSKYAEDKTWSKKVNKYINEIKAN